MNVKFAGLFILIGLFSLFLVAAVTLTKDSTEKVIIKKSYRVLVEDSVAGEESEMVFGHADIYAKDGDGSPAARLAIFVHEGVLYRSTGFSPDYEQFNCHEVTVTDPPEKGGDTRREMSCESGRVLGERGGGSIVHADGNEENDVFQYVIGLEDNGDLNNLEFKFNHEDRVLTLKQVIKVVDEEIEWRPE